MTAPAKCFRPAVFFHHVGLGLIALSFPQGKLLRKFQNVLTSTSFFTFIKLRGDETA
jgi:hypothetical protein